MQWVPKASPLADEQGDCTADAASLTAPRNSVMTGQPAEPAEHGFLVSCYLCPDHGPAKSCDPRLKVSLDFSEALREIGKLNHS